MKQDFVIAWRCILHHQHLISTHLVIRYDKPTTHPDVLVTDIEMVTSLSSMNTYFVRCKLRLL